MRRVVYRCEIAAGHNYDAERRHSGSPERRNPSTALRSHGASVRPKPLAAPGGVLGAAALTGRTRDPSRSPADGLFTSLSDGARPLVICTASPKFSPSVTLRR